VLAMLAKFWISATARGQRGKLALKIASPHFSYRGVFGRQSLRRVVERGEESGGCGVNGLVSTFASLIAGSDP